MKTYKYDKIRNIALLGHGGSGKTTLVESVLAVLGETKKMGQVTEGNTVSDFEKEEIARGFSIGTSVIPVEYNGTKYNFLDNPGYFDFVGDVFSALRVAGGAVIMVDATSGIQVGTEKAWTYCEKRNMPRIIFINKMDKENVNYVKVIRELKDTFGKKIAPFTIPLGESEDFKGFVNVVDLKGREYNGKACVDVPIPKEMEPRIAPVRDMLIESVAESNEELMEKFFEGEEFTMEEIHNGLREGVLTGEIVPVVIGSAEKQVGVNTLMNMIYDYLPTPKDLHEGEYEGINPKTNEKKVQKVDENGPFSALVFKTIVDPFVGKISIFKVYSGMVKKDMEVLNPNRDEVEKINNIFLLRGKSQLEVSEISAGDIGATAKLQYAHTGDTLCDKNNPIQYPGIKFPSPALFKAIEPKAQGDEEKIGVSLQKLNDEDPSFTLNRNKETKQLVIGGQGNIQIDVIVSKLKRNFGVEVTLSELKIPYRETIKGTATVQGKHKKQSGGAGQYGDVHIKFEPSTEAFIFEEKIFGGSVPKNYIPAVEKGLEESLEKGVLAGFHVVNIKATLLDGSYHAVDSSEMAFKMAAHVAFKKGMQEAQPILLEPIMHLEIVVPDEFMGDIMGDMNKRRGRIQGMQPDEKGYQKVIAEAPQSELLSYATDLRSMTQAKGFFKMDFARYDEVPMQLAVKIIEEAKKEE
ncbi:MAG: elongation factor G [delta proteobacterium ML8_F1]|nr:MAG: elongation factor G [delta proteobacterium ML8_F1]